VKLPAILAMLSGNENLFSNRAPYLRISRARRENELASTPRWLYSNNYKKRLGV
jgi:hypothetical protein